MHRQNFDAPAPSGRKAWRAPRVAKLAAGSAESGPSTEEDGDFNAS